MKNSIKNKFYILFIVLIVCLVFSSTKKSYASFSCGTHTCTDGQTCGYDTSSAPCNQCAPNAAACQEQLCELVCMGGGGCFLPGTKVESTDGDKNIEDIKVGDTVTSFDENGQISQSDVNKIYEVKRDHYFSLVAGSFSVDATAEHPFLAKDNTYTEIKDLKTGDLIYVLENDTMVPKMVTSNTRIDKPTVAYNLSVDNKHTFFANNFAVHNKGYPFPTCSSGTLVCASPAVNISYNFVDTCAQAFPSRVNGSGTCQTNCGCCPPGDTYSCQAGTHDYTYTSGHTNNNGNPSSPMYCDVGAYISGTGASNCQYDEAWNPPDFMYCTYTSTCTNACNCSSSTPNVMYNCRTDVDPNPDNSYTCRPTSSTYSPDPTGINLCQANVATYVVNPPFPTPGGVAMSTGICSTTQSSCAQNCCRQIYRCQNDGSCAQTTNSYYSNDGPGNPGFQDCNNGLATTCTQNIQNLVDTGQLPPQNNYSCYSTLASCQASCVAAPAPVNGVCATTHYNCSAGALGPTAEYADQWQWWCNGVYGGTNILCAEIKPVTIQVRGVSLSSIPQTCAEILASSSYRTGSVFDVAKNGEAPVQQTQSGSTYLTWSNTAGTYTVSSAEGAAAAIRYCRTQGATGSNTFGSSSVTATAGTTTTFNVSFSPFGPWFQIRGGGDVYSTGTIVSKIPSTASVRRFVLDGGPAGSLFPGVVTYGSAAALPYDFDESPDSQGETIVSTKNWLARQQNTSLDLYAMFYAKFGVPSLIDYVNPTSPITQPVSRQKPYYVTGDAITTGNWTVGTGEHLILIVDGNITIGGSMQTTGTGVIVVIAKNDLSFASTVGVSAGSATAIAEGVYIAGGTLHTGVSTTAGAERFVGSGMFIGNTVSLERDLSLSGSNLTTAAELFVYDPSYLVTMPEEMKDLTLSWQEVAP